MGPYLTIPNALTSYRIACIPLVLYAYAQSLHGFAIAVLAASLLTDFLDGQIARRWNQESPFGALLDPVADKFVVIAFVSYAWTMGACPTWAAIVYLARNIAQLMAIPILMVWLKRPFHVRPKWQPKWAGFLAFVLLPIFLFDKPLGLGIQGTPVYFGVLFVSLALELYVLVTYVPRLIQIARGTHDTFE